MVSLRISTVFCFFFIFASLTSANGATTVHGKLFQATTNFIMTSCQATHYPEICYNSLQSYASLVRRRPRQLALIALSVSLDRARSMSAALSRMKAANRGSMSRREVGAMKDCLETLGDSVYLLKQSVKEMEGMGNTGNWGLQINDLQTWVSAALTDEDTCMEGFSGDGAVDVAEIKSEVRSSILRVAQLTSNALDFINQLSQVGKKVLP
ncbi:pectinesterase inhibitor 7-like [Nymphaea colorata]|nr:pectinesterase inhibitor 7-like [Nymphaea colorata]